MPNNDDRDSDERSGSGSREAQIRNNWWSSAMGCILEKCRMYEVGQNAYFSEHHNTANNQSFFFFGVPNTSYVEHAEARGQTVTTIGAHTVY